MTNKTLTALPGVRVGHSTHLEKLTGATVILFDQPYTVAYQAFGSSVGLFNSESLRVGQVDYRQNAIFIAGGSDTGLMTGAALIESLRKDKKGAYMAEDIYNPSVVGAIIWDLGVNIAPYQQHYGSEAYQAATSQPVISGNVGAGTGASVGKFAYLEKGLKTGAMKAGIGSARIDLGGGIIVCALSVVNAMGNIYLPDGQILAGNRDEKVKFKTYADFIDLITLKNKANTTISIVGLNVDLETKENYDKLARLAVHGQIRSIKPVHTSFDGDVVFVFSTASLKDPFNRKIKHFQPGQSRLSIEVDTLGYIAAQAVQDSIYDACRSAQTISFEQAYQGIIPATKN